MKRHSIRIFAQTRPVAILGMVAIILMVMVALAADVVATHDPLAQDLAQRLEPPGPDRYFGTDGFGRDIFSRVVHGARVSLYVGLLAVGLASVVGVSVGTDLLMPEPLCCSACHMPTDAPVGPLKKQSLPASITCIGGTVIVAPSSAALAAAASISSTLT